MNNRKLFHYLRGMFHVIVLYFLLEFICGNPARKVVYIHRLKAIRNLRLRGAGDDVDEAKLTYSLRDMQRGALEELIARAVPDNVTVCGPWKTLFFDRHWRDIFVCALKPSELHLHGVLCHQLLDQPKDDLPEYPAVYFFNSEHTNVSILAKDINEDRFESIYLYTSGPTALEMWNDFCAHVDPELFVSRVRTVSDIFADYISLGN